MRYSQMLLPTLKESPAEAEVVSHKLLLRGGFIRKLTSGVYSYLPIGLRAIRKVEAIVREEMNRAGAQELLMPMVQPGDLWEETGRWQKYGPELLRFHDRHERPYCLGPTHEEVITDIVRKNVQSYRNLPVNLYQIQTKFRDEIRPRFGLMRGREFIMKDGYSFDADEAGANKTYLAMYDAYHRIFSRLGLAFRAVEADTGSIGGSFSHEFMVLAETGEDTIVICKGCSYAANMEKALCAAAHVTEKAAAEQPLTRVATPGKRTVEEVTAFLGISPRQLVKTMIYMADGKPVAVLLRGDHEVQPIKLKNILKADAVELATDEEIETHLGAVKGYLGPVGLSIPLVADSEVMAMSAFVTGANELDCHCLHVRGGRDFQATITADIRMVTAADHCAQCGGALELTRGIEVGHIFKLGLKYSEAMGATFLDAKGGAIPFVMGCYGIGVSRIVAAAIEQNHDKDGIIFPVPIAPFQVVILNLAMKEAAAGAAIDELCGTLEAAGVEVLVDDRDERPGIKFKDADLIGIPFRIMVGKQFLQEGVVEIRVRRTGETTVLPLAEVAARIITLLRGDA